MNFDDGGKEWWLSNGLGARIKFTKLEDGNFDVYHLGGCIALPTVRMVLEEAQKECHEYHVEKGWILVAWK